jgi:hypothetical protein
MTQSARTVAFASAFAVAYPLLYVACAYWNLALFTYHPALGDFGIGPNAPRGGPAMYWYGWMSTALIAAAMLSAGWAAFAGQHALRIPSLFASLVPIAAMAVAVALMFHFFLQ